MLHGADHTMRALNGPAKGWLDRSERIRMAGNPPSDLLDTGPRLGVGRVCRRFRELPREERAHQVAVLVSKGVPLIPLLATQSMDRPKAAFLSSEVPLQHVDCSHRRIEYEVI